MTGKIFASVAAALCLTAAPAVSGQKPVSKTRSVSATATIQAIDAANRTITLRDEQGNEDTYTAGPEVKRVDEFKVGDKVKMTYYESVVLQVRQPGEEPPEKTVGTAMSRGKGAAPGGTLAAQERMTVTVKAIDPSVPSVTVTTPEGRTVTRRVEDKKNIEGLKAGDQIDITYTVALLASIEHAK